MDIKNYQSPLIIEERKSNLAVFDVFSRLLINRIIFIGDVITDDLANIVIAQLLYLDSQDSETPIQVYINSPGGSVYAGLGIYDTMNLISAPVNTVCVGLAASMGAMLLIAGKERKILKHSRVMLHQPMGGIRGQVTDMEIELAEIKKLKEELYKIVKDKTLITNPEEVLERAYWMNAEEAKSLGIIDIIK